MADATNMPELHENAPTLCVYSSLHLATAVDLVLRVDAGRVLIALALLRNLGGLGNNQPCRRALGVVFGGEVAGHEAAPARLRVSGAMTMRFASVIAPRLAGSKSVVFVMISL